MEWMPRGVTAGLLLVWGCSIETTGLHGRDGGPPGLDAGLDAAAPDAGDASVPADAPARDRDAPPADATTVVCEPGTQVCEADRSALMVCNETGTATMRVACLTGCDPDVADCAVIPDCGLAVEGDLEPGTPLSFSTCGGGSELGATTTDMCSQRGNGEDRMFRFLLDRARHVTLDVHATGGDDVDTMLYVRTFCEDEASQIACDDDVPCSEADPEVSCGGSGYQTRQSHLELDLDAGAYWVVVDSIDWHPGGTLWYGCGDVVLRYDAT